MARFDETVNINPQVGSLGSASQDRVSSALSSFASQRRASREQRMIRRQAEKGAEEFQSGESPNFKDEGGVGSYFIPAIGKSREAYNSGLRAAYLSSVDRDAQLGLADIRNSSQDLSDFGESAEQYKLSLLEGVDPSSRSMLSRSLDDSIAAHSRSIQQQDFKRNDAIAADELKLSVQTFGEEAGRHARNGDPHASAESLLKQRETLDAMIESGQISPAMANDVFNNANRGATEESYLKGIDDLSPEDALQKISKDSEKVPKGFTVNEWQALMENAKSVVSDEINLQKMQGVGSSLEELIKREDFKKDMTSGGRPAASLMSEAKYMWESGQSTIKEFAANVSDIRELSSKQGDLSDRLATGDQSIAIDKDVTNSFYEESFADGANPAMKASFARSTGFVPKALKEEVLLGLRSSDLNQVSESISMMDRLDQDRGLAENAFSDQQRAFAGRMESLMSYYSPQEAAQIALKMTDPNDRAAIEHRTATLAERAKKTDYFSEADDALDSFIKPGIDEITTGPAIANDYKNIYESLVLSGADSDFAEKKASDLINKEWSLFNGHYTKNAPNKYYSVHPGDDGAWISKQARADINKASVVNKIEDMVFYSDDRTAREATAGKPTYLIKYFDGEQWYRHPFRFEPNAGARSEELKKANKALLDGVTKSAPPELGSKFVSGRDQ